MLNRKTLSIDWCPDNSLRMHFGMALGDQQGWALNLLEQKDWYAAGYQSDSGLDFLPFGRVAKDDELEQLVAWMRKNPGAFAEQLDTLQMPADTIVLCDCPRAPLALRKQAVVAADLVFVLASPDPMSYGAAVQLVAEISDAEQVETIILLNKFDSTRRLDRDISVLLNTQQKQHLAPVHIHRDESVREALACKQLVFDFSPSSQAAYDFTTLATWTLARLGQATESV